jgi:hypothetical protein
VAAEKAAAFPAIGQAVIPDGGLVLAHLYVASFDPDRGGLRALLIPVRVSERPFHLLRVELAVASGLDRLRAFDGELQRFERVAGLDRRNDEASSVVAGLRSKRKWDRLPLLDDGGGLG